MYYTFIKVHEFVWKNAFILGRASHFYVAFRDIPILSY